MSDPAVQLPAPTASPAPARGSRQRIITAIVCLAPSFIVMLSAFVPLLRQAESNDLDWLPLLSEVHARGLHWGSEIVFTYGPWGFVWNGYDPRTFGQLCLFWTIAAAVVWWVMLSMVRQRWGKSIFVTGAVMWVLALASGGDYTCSSDVRLMMLPMLLLLYHFFFKWRDCEPGKLGLVALVAFTGLVKFPYLLTGMMVLGLMSLDPAVPLRRRWPPVIVFGLTFLAGWLTAGQRLSDLPAHIRWSMELTSGYGEAMSLWSRTETTQVTLSVIADSLLLIAITITAVRGLGRRAIWFLPGAAALLLMAFRSGFVRHDVHEIIATGFMLNAALLGCLALWPHIRGRLGKIGWGACLACVLIVASKSESDWYDESLPQQMSYTLTGVAAESAELASIVTGHPSKNYLQWQAIMAAIVSHVPLPQVRGSADLFPKDATVLLAFGMDYQPRPTLQSYTAYTPALSRLNAQRLTGPDPPDNILIRIDFRTFNLPTLADTDSWLQILCRYQLEQTTPDYMLLVKRPVPLKPKMTLLVDGMMPLGVAGQVTWNPGQPPPPMIWAKIDVPRKRLGVLLSQFYKPPPLVLNVKTQSGLTQFARIIPANAAEGFLFGPFVIDNNTFAELAAPDPQPQSWKGMMPDYLMVGGLGSINYSWYFQESAHVQLYGLTLEKP